MYTPPVPFEGRARGRIGKLVWPLLFYAASSKGKNQREYPKGSVPYTLQDGQGTFHKSTSWKWFSRQVESGNYCSNPVQLQL